MQVISEFWIQFCIRSFFSFKPIQVYCIYHTHQNDIHPTVTAKISVLGCNAMESGRHLQMFQSDLLPQLSGCKNTQVNFYQTTWHHTPDDINLHVYIIHAKLKCKKKPELYTVSPEIYSPCTTG
jgi:hypothetical protein